nr:DUF4826 family protein [Thalassotalea crassostreae]
MSTENAITEEQTQQWVREQYLNATKYLAEKGVVTQSVEVQTSRYLAPIFAVWKLKTIDNDAIWVISGDLPCDHIQAEAADTVRDSLRHFSMKWQLQAQNIAGTTTEQAQFAKFLVGRAEGLYQLFENENLWKEG